MRSATMKWLRRTALLFAMAVVTFLGIRIYDTQRRPPLELWHTFAPSELSADELDQADWGQYLAAEGAAFEAVHREVDEQVEPDDRVPFNRYFEGSPVHPGELHPGLEPFLRAGARGRAGRRGRAPARADRFPLQPAAHRAQLSGARLCRGRDPAAGPRHRAGGLADVEWEDWLAATRLAVREARGRIGPALPLHLVGFSNGGALAMKYALDALEDPALTRPERIVLISPMIGITTFARFAGFAGLPALLPHFAKAAWLGILPEFNPFKYNSFPVNGARQSCRLTQALQDTAPAPRPRRQAGRSAPGPDLPVGDRLYGQHARDRHGAVRPPA